jgi:exopolysaccharide biosynthesis protein
MGDDLVEYMPQIIQGGIIIAVFVAMVIPLVKMYEKEKSLRQSIYEEGITRREISKRKRELRKIRVRRVAGLTIFIVMYSGSVGLMLVRAGIFPRLQEFLVTSAMTTLSHKYIANIVADDGKIKDIMESNKVDENYDNSDTSLIEEKDPGTDDKIKIEDVTGNGYVGYMMIVDDPSRVFIGTTDKLGEYGSKISDLVKKYDAVAGINAGGFSDENGHGKGGTPTGLIIEDGQVKYRDKSISTFSIIGFNKDNVLVLGKYSMSS